MAFSLLYSSSMTLFSFSFDDMADELATLFAPTIMCGTDAADWDATDCSPAETKRTRGLFPAASPPCWCVLWRMDGGASAAGSCSCFRGEELGDFEDDGACLPLPLGVDGCRCVCVPGLAAFESVRASAVLADGWGCCGWFFGCFFFFFPNNPMAPLILSRQVSVVCLWRFRVWTNGALNNWIFVGDLDPICVEC